MNIAEATKKAMEKGRCIERPFGEGRKKIRIKPTDGPDCCIAYGFDGRPHKRWMPMAEDLIAEDWEVAGE